MKNPRRTAKYQKLKNQLTSDLQARGLANEIYLDKVAEYLDLWTQRQLLREDIDERGFFVIDERGREIENRSVSLEIQVSRQMLQIFAALGYKDTALRADAGDGDDEL